jgi:hypothetical protein
VTGCEAFGHAAFRNLLSRRGRKQRRATRCVRVSNIGGLRERLSLEHGVQTFGYVRETSVLPSEPGRPLPQVREVQTVSVTPVHGQDANLKRMRSSAVARGTRTPNTRVCSARQAASRRKSELDAMRSTATCFPGGPYQNLTKPLATQ